MKALVLWHRSNLMSTRARNNSIAVLIVVAMLALLARPAASQTKQIISVTRADSGNGVSYITTVARVTCGLADSLQVRSGEAVRTKRIGFAWTRWSTVTAGGTLPPYGCKVVQPPPPPSVVSKVEINPKTVTIVTGGAWSFFAYAHWSSGTTNDSSVTSGFTFTATGGTLAPSSANAVLYTAGAPGGTSRVVATHYTGKADTAVVTITAPTPLLVAVRLSPDSLAGPTGVQMQFGLIGQYSDGMFSPVPAAWNASGGTITTGGLYTAGATAGTFRVIGSNPASGKADTSVVTLTAPQPPPPPGPYVPIAARDWRTVDKADLAGVVGVEGGLHTHDPPLSPTVFYDLVPDPVFGKVMRYHGGPHLNTTQTAMGGRVAVYLTKLGSCAGLTPGTTWWLAPNGCKYPTHLWVRQFIRFSPNWTNDAKYGGQGTGDYKTMFLRYYNSAARHGFHVTRLREWTHGGGNPGLGAFIEEGTLPWNTVQSLNQQYSTSGFPGPDLYPMIRVSNPTSSNCFPGAAPCAHAGDGEWYETIIHHNTVGSRGEFTQYLRRYTSGGVANPGPWKIHALYSVAQVGKVFSGIESYQMGINRNRQYDEVMFHDWGPFEVVDGGVYVNPFKVPCPAAGC